MGECLSAKCLHSKASKPRWRQRHAQTLVFQRGHTMSMWRSVCVCVTEICVRLSTCLHLFTSLGCTDCTPVPFLGLSSFCVAVWFILWKSVGISPCGASCCQRLWANAPEPQRETLCLVLNQTPLTLDLDMFFTAVGTFTYCYSHAVYISVRALCLDSSSDCMSLPTERQVFLATWKDIPNDNESQFQIKDCHLNSGEKDEQRNTALCSHILRLLYMWK